MRSISLGYERTVIDRFSQLFLARRKPDIETRQIGCCYFAESENNFEAALEPVLCSKLKLPMQTAVVNGERYFNASFAMYVATEEDEGLYNLYFHNCPNYHGDQVALDYTVCTKSIKLFF